MTPVSSLIVVSVRAGELRGILNMWAPRDEVDSCPKKQEGESEKERVFFFYYWLFTLDSVSLLVGEFDFFPFPWSPSPACAGKELLSAECA